MKTIKCRPVLIESKEPTNIFLFPNNKLFWNNEEGVFKQLIFISLEDDKIKEGDLFYTGKSIKICAKYDDCLGYYTDDGNTFLYIQPNHRKVITLQPQIPETYIQQFIEEYNNGEVKDVEIEMEEDGDCEIGGREYINYLPKLTNGFVTIINDRLFNESNVEKIDINKYLKEALELAKKNKLITDSDKNYFIYAGQVEALESVIDYIKGRFINTAISYLEPILYTEEEVKDLLKLCLKEFSTTSKIDIPCVDEWFEQNKKEIKRN